MEFNFSASAENLGVITLDEVGFCGTPAGFPSPAQDDMEEPIDLGAWLIDHPGASYIMRVSAESMTGAGINDGDLVIVSRGAEPRPGTSWLPWSTAIGR